jgi:SPP1 gp7 family putative phage head morphogenesis protein
MGVMFISKNYWGKRIARMQHKIADKSIDDTNEQIKKYYKAAMKNCIKQFEATYDKLQAQLKEGVEPTPAHLYNLDKYWELQAQLREELNNLGEKEIVAMSKNFEKTWKDVYDSVAMKSQPNFSKIDNGTVQQMINGVWCADGKTWSQRIWNNTENLAQTLNEELVNCVVTGKKTDDLLKLLQEKFNVSYRQAESLVRTEIAHIQVQAAAQRYKDYGLEEYEYFADTDEKTCPICGKLDGKKFKYLEMKIGENAPPLHTNCRCDILPVVKIGELKENKIKLKN